MNGATSGSVSVVVPVRNAAATVATQVRAVLAQLHDGDRVVAVDNRSTDATARVLYELRREDPRVRIVEAPLRAGVAHARNAGVAATDTDLVLFCDADDRVHPGWRDAMVDGLMRHDLVGGGLHRVSGHRPGPGEQERTPDLAVEVPGELPTIFDHHRYPVGANMGVRRTVLQRIGGFDESFVRGHEETDFAWRAQDTGYTLGYVPDAVVDYTERADARGELRRFRHYGRTSLQLWCRHRDKLPPHGVSARGAVRALVTLLPSALGLVRGTAEHHSARRLGWALGVVEGHARYRVLGRVPEARIPGFPAGCPTE
ncbi:glycosyltransferase [Kocuria soli]|uniref:Glycosyltransferase n=1 Tax=Kocuria soli TaxID=2485125 RepID=A0A3N3ZWY6_9MICC|nr:glycosyltransferase [Kocuria soli]ROZ63030.1 glycosyltransferase [Kocuria soli]